MKAVLCITLNPAIDMTITLQSLTLGAVNRATHGQTTPAGKGLNVAHVLSELGVNGVASGFLGLDNDELFSALFASHEDFKSIEGIGKITDGFVKVAGATRTNVKLVDNGRTTDINGQGFVVTQKDKDELFAKLEMLVQGVDAVLVAGSLPNGFDGQDFDRLLHILTNKHDKVAVDVSGEALKIALTHQLWLIKPNNDELSAVFGGDMTVLDNQKVAISQIASIKNILVSMGDKGVHWFCQENLYRATPPTVSVKSTVGAGDTMVAGMMFGLLTQEDEQKSNEDVLRFATALSAHAVMVVGVNVPNPLILNELLSQTQVEQLS
ncbi:1-phosphofructokinase family hexose kinase [Moraxella oblonga]|uniref:1-phosphofructokinase family hexose kinase n=1 Tax=Moraxella oblonga TaxID=200413 RepID=UPI00083455A8|nr:1-phosphofructokinase family hexose kinase [Moraxella oblonga]